MNGLIAFTAQWALAAPFFAVLYVLLRRRTWNLDVIELFVSSVLTIVLVKMGGAIYQHPRPFVLNGTVPLVPHALDNAFPSDHLAACGVAVGFLRKRNELLAVVVILIAGLIGAARVLAQLHSSIDVIAGLLFGVLGNMVASTILRLTSRREVD